MTPVLFPNSSFCRRLAAFRPTPPDRTTPPDRPANRPDAGPAPDLVAGPAPAADPALARLPPRFRAFYRRSDAALAGMGLERGSLAMFQPGLRIRREDLLRAPSL